MKKRVLAPIFLLVLLVLVSGCTQQQNQNSIPQKKTCSELGGYSCTENEQCFGTTLDSSNAQTCCSVVCSQKTDQNQTQTKSCSEQNGFVCKTGEKCQGNTLEARDSTSCCSVACAKIETQPIEKSLEELNLKISDFPDGFVLNDIVSGYQNNALEYADGNREKATELLAAGWEENYRVNFIRRSESQEINGTKVIVAQYDVSLSSYDKTKGYSTYFRNYIQNIKKSLEEMPQELKLGITTMPQEFGNNSFFTKLIINDETSGSTTISYLLFFTKNNIAVNFVAIGQERQITDEKVIEYAKKIESRIQ